MNIENLKFIRSDKHEEMLWNKRSEYNYEITKSEIRKVITSLHKSSSVMLV